MISISIDLGNTPSVLEALRDTRNAQLVADAAAESFVNDIHDWIKSGKGFTPRNGQLQQSINWQPNDNGTAEVYANAEYAGYVERGTGIHAGHKPWVISPKAGRKGLKIPTGGVASPVGPQMAGGGYVIRRSVNHPGSKAHPFFFADLDNRQQHMQERALSVLAAKLAQAS